MAKLTVGTLEKEQAELQEERASQVGRLQELEARLESGDASLKELRTAADEMAEIRSFVRALDKRLVAVGQQLRDLEQAERKARVVALHAEEQDAFDLFAEALDALAEGPMQNLLDAQAAVRNAQGFPQYGHRARVAVKGITGFRRHEVMRQSAARAKRGRAAK